MDAVIHKAKNFREAEAWDIEQQIKMTPEAFITPIRICHSGRFFSSL